jgi:F-type H+-transporting ATPase subunit a
MMGGHTVIAVLLLYIATTADSWLWYLVVPSSIFGQIFVGTLELLVAFIQAYIFAFLATLFIGMAVNPH